MHKILKYKTVPAPPDSLNEFLREILEENSKYLQTQEEQNLQKMQQKDLNVLGTLSKRLEKIENSRKGIKLVGLKLTYVSFRKLMKNPL